MAARAVLLKTSPWILRTSLKIQALVLRSKNFSAAVIRFWNFYRVRLAMSFRDLHGFEGG